MEAQTAAVETAGTGGLWVITAFQHGGIFMYPILLFAVLTLGLILERFAFFLTVKAPPFDFRRRLLEFSGRGDYKGATTTAKTYSATALGRVASIGCSLRASGSGEEEIQARMDERLTQEISRIDRRTGFLAMFGNVSTLLGLLGTIAGMIQSFAAVAQANPADRAMMLSKGISEAMNCTAFGLLVAIPALIAFSYFQNATDRAVTDLTERVTEIYNDLLFLAEGPSAASRAGVALSAAQSEHNH